jgi:hypothetical protein
MKLRIIVMLIWCGISARVLADSGVPPFWYFESAKGSYKFNMSRQAEADSYNGDSDGPVKSALEVYKQIRGQFDKKPTFVTKVVCESKRAPPDYLKCANDGGPFSNANYTALETWVKEGRSFKKVQSFGVDENASQKGKKLLSNYIKATRRGNSDDIYSVQIFRCVGGCNGEDTPAILIEINLLGD